MAEIKSNVDTMKVKEHATSPNRSLSEADQNVMRLHLIRRMTSTRFYSLEFVECTILPRAHYKIIFLCSVQRERHKPNVRQCSLTHSKDSYRLPMCDRYTGAEVALTST